VKETYYCHVMSCRLIIRLSSIRGVIDSTQSEQQMNKSSAIADTAAQSCTIRVSAVECGYLSLTHFLSNYL